MRSSPMMATLLVALFLYTAATAAQQRPARVAADVPTGTASLPTRQVSLVTIQGSTRNSMTVAVDYASTGPEAATLTALWTKRNGHAVPFTRVSTLLPADARQVLIETRHTGVLPPPNKLVLTLDVHSAGRTVAQYECQLWLVNQQGSVAWAADLAKGETLTWRNQGCATRH